MGESTAHCSEEIWSNGYDKRERRGDPDTPSNEMERLHRLSKAELYIEEGPLPSPIHRPNPGPTGRIKLLLLSRRIFGLQPDCDSSRQSREDEVHMSFWHIRLHTHVIRTVQHPRDLSTMYDGNLIRLSWRQLRGFHGKLQRLWKRLWELSCTPDQDHGGLR